MNERVNVVDQDDQFIQHSYNALFGNRLENFEAGLQREMILAVADHMMNQMCQESKNLFLTYIRRRVETN